MKTVISVTYNPGGEVSPWAWRRTCSSWPPAHGGPPDARRWRLPRWCSQSLGTPGQCGWSRTWWYSWGSSHSSRTDRPPPASWTAPVFITVTTARSSLVSRSPVMASHLTILVCELCFIMMPYRATFLSLQLIFRSTITSLTTRKYISKTLSYTARVYYSSHPPNI